MRDLIRVHEAASKDLRQPRRRIQGFVATFRDGIEGVRSTLRRLFAPTKASRLSLHFPRANRVDDRYRLVDFAFLDREPRK
jgi:hypothetical protein